MSDAGAVQNVQSSKMEAMTKKSQATADNRGAISLAIRIESFDQNHVQVRIRGWHPTPSQIERIEIRSKNGDLMAETTFSEDRPDVIQNERNTDGNPRCGFNLTLSAGPTQADEFTVDFVGKNGVTVSRRAGKTTKIADFFIERMEYDEPSRRLSYLGRFNPSKQCRSAMISSRDKNFPVPKLFERRPETTGGQFDWFYGVVHPINPNDIRTLSFVFTTIDGKKSSIDLSKVEIIRNPPLLEVESASFNFLNGDLRISGWCRAFEEFSHLSFELGEQELFCMPTASFSKVVQDRHGFRGPLPTGWNVKTKIVSALDDPRILLSGKLPMLRVKLMARRKILVEKLHPIEYSSVVSTAIDLCLYNQKNSYLTIMGRAADRRIAGIKVSRRGQAVAKVELQSSSREFVELDSNQSWDWISASEINARLNPGEVLDVEFIDEGGVSLTREGPAPSRMPVLRSTAVGFIEGSPNIANLLFNMMCQPRSFEVPLLMVAFPGSMTAGGGGGSARLLQLLAFLKNCGFAICLIDRSEPWDMAAHSKKYIELMKNVDFHIPLAPSLEKAIATLAVNKLAERNDKHGQMLHEKLKQAIEKERRSNAPSLIQRRSNEVFNQLAAFFANLFPPSLFFSSFVWTASTFDSLAAGVTRVLDAHDVQSARYKSFKAAQKFYGEEIPDSVVEVYAQDPREEAKFLNKADVVLAISPSEARIMNDMIGTHKVVNAGFGLSEVLPMPHNPTTKKILFVGNKYLPNSHAVERFMESALPKIREEHPDAELHVCGSVCEELGMRPVMPEGIVLRGFVSDLLAEYASSAIVINPVQFGSGMSIKTPEALGFGKAVVCSPYIAESLPGLTEAEAAIVTPVDEMYKPICQLLSDPVAREALEQRAVTYARNCLTNEYVLADLLNIIETKVFY